MRDQKILKIASFSGFLLKIIFFVKTLWILFQITTKCREVFQHFPRCMEVFQDFPRCRDILQNFPCRVPDFSMFYEKLACILFMCLQNFTAFSTGVPGSTLHGYLSKILARSCQDLGKILARSCQDIGKNCKMSW